MNFSEIDGERAEHPVDIVERVAAHNAWTFDREQRDEISIAVAGQWTDYNVAFTWLPEIEALHIACAFDLKLVAVNTAMLLFSSITYGMAMMAMQAGTFGRRFMVRFAPLTFVTGVVVSIVVGRFLT